MYYILTDFCSPRHMVKENKSNSNSSAYLNSL